MNTKRYAPAPGSSERAAWDRLDVGAKQLHAGWHEDDADAVDAIFEHPQQSLILRALGY